MDAIDFPYLVTAPNLPILVVNGEVRLDAAGTSITGPGAFSLVWGPTPRIVLDSTRQTTFAEFQHLNQGTISYELIGRSRPGTCRLLKGQFRESAATRDELSAQFFVYGELFLDSPCPVEELRFGIVNLEDRLRYEDVHGVSNVWRGGLTFDVKGLKFEIHSASPTISEDLMSQGGYAVTHVVRVTKTDGGTISTEEAETIRFATRNWLTFMRGKRVGVPAMLGCHQGQICWESWQGIDVAPREGDLPWFPDLIVSPFARETVESLPSVFSFFLDYGKDENDSALLRAIDWYTQLLASPRPSTRIALSGFGLEQFAWWYLCLSGWLTEEAFEKLTLAEVVGLCMARAGLPSELPSSIDPIVGGRITKSPRGPQLIAEARNSVVHPKSKNFDIESLSLEEKHLVSEFIIQQLELLVLFVLNYKGSFIDRVDGRKEKLVPWV